MSTIQQEKENSCRNECKDYKKDFTKNQIPRRKTRRVLEIISQHSTEKLYKPRSLETKILFDADKLPHEENVTIAIDNLRKRGHQEKEPQIFTYFEIKKAWKLLASSSKEEMEESIENP